MKAGTFNIHDYLGKLYEEMKEEDLDKILNEEDGKISDPDGIIIPEEGKKAYDWLKKEYQKGKTEVKVEMSSHDFKPGYNTEIKEKSIEDFKPGIYNNPNKITDKAVPFPETKFPGSETKNKSDDKIDNKNSIGGEKKKTVPKVSFNTAPKKQEVKKDEESEEEND